MITNDMKEKPIKITFNIIWILIVLGIIIALVVIAFIGPAFLRLDFIKGFVSKLFTPVG